MNGTAETELKRAFAAAKQYIGFELSESETEFVPREGNGFCVQKENGKATIFYSDRHFVFHAAACLKTMENGVREICGPFQRFGVMLDCARNGVPNIEQLKTFIVRLAFAGYSYIGLYLEDCFEVDNEPFFGYMRGRYSKAELREIVDFAQMFGIEVVPYIQTLAHLSNIFHHWEEYTATVKDFGDILLIGEPRTYTLIENMLKTVSEVFVSKNINVGMDEAFMMLFGKYRKLNGIQNRAKIFSQHIARVCELCQKYGLHPSAWADMFEHNAQDENLHLPENLQLTVWDYVDESAEKYIKRIEGVCKLTNRVSFAGGIHKWYGYAPLNQYTQKTLPPSVDAAKNRVDDYCVTLWCDDGAECSYNAVWYSLLKISEYVYGTSDLARVVTGYSSEELLAMDLPNQVFEGMAQKPVNVSKYTLFEDVFYGISDRRSSEEFAKYFKENGQRLRKLASKTGDLSYLYEEYADLCEILELKTGIRDKLLRAYRAKDRREIGVLAEQTANIAKKVSKFQKSVEKQWMHDYKPFGIEVQQIRLGGLISRLNYIVGRLQQYADGIVDVIEELEERDLSPILSGNCEEDAKCFNSYEQNVTYGMISHKLFN